MSEIRVRYLLYASLILILAIYGYIVVNAALVNDDYMAIYTTWLLSAGKVAEVDFNVDSYTLLFDWMASAYHLVGERFEIVYLFRSVFLLLLIAIAAQVYVIVRQFASVNITLTTLVLLFSSSAMIVRGIDLRPDLVILFLWLQTIIVLYLKSTSDAYKFFITGILLTLAMLFKFKAILICVVIGFHGLSCLIERRSISALAVNITALFAGVLITILLFVATAGSDSFNLFIDTTRELLFYSASQAGKAGTLKWSVLKLYFLQDAVFWLLALMGVALASRQWRSVSVTKRQCLLMLLMLAAISIAANPHYHAYNVVTLYPLIAVFVAFSVQYVVASGANFSAGKILFCSVVILFLLVRSLVHPIKHNNHHQVALQAFIESELQTNQAVFAYEGIGLFRPSTYHWRTSAIKIDNYHAGRYNVWQEITEVKPVIIIENYRVPGWLLEQDRAAIERHYVPLTPLVLTIGLKSESKIVGEILSSGWYILESDSGQSCFVDGAEQRQNDKLWLEAGQHTLQSAGGVCVLRWYFSEPELESLRRSNVDSRPYLFSP